MNPGHILQMMQRLERVFVRECAKVEVNSQIMLNRIADNRAENNFYILMAAIKNESIKKTLRQRYKDQLEEEKKNASATRNTGAAGASVVQGD